MYILWFYQAFEIEWDEKDASIALNGLVIIVDAFIFVLSTVA